MVNNSDKISPVLSYENGEVISLRQVFKFFSETKLLIIGFTFVFSILSAFWIASLTDEYTAEAILVSSQDSGSGNLSGLMGQVGSLASIAGLDLGNKNSNNVSVALEILKSRVFINTFIKQHSLYPEMLAVIGWDKSIDHLLYNKKNYDITNNRWSKEAIKNKIYSPWKAYSIFMKKLTVDHNIKSGMVTISFEYFSPTIAKKILNNLISELNRYMKKEAVDELEKSIKYLKQESLLTDISGLKNVFYSLIEEQTKQLMFAKIRDDYTFKIISPAVLPEEKSKPRRAFLGILMFFVGFLFSILLAVIYSSFTTRNS